MKNILKLCKYRKFCQILQNNTILQYDSLNVRH